MRFDDRIHQGSGGHPVKDEPRRFFYALFTGAYSTYVGDVALAPDDLASELQAAIEKHLNLDTLYLDRREEEEERRRITRALPSGDEGAA